jgi:hypothetical protein
VAAEPVWEMSGEGVMSIAAGPWSWLEIAKLVVGSITPIVAAYVGFMITKQIKKLDSYAIR